MKNSNQQPTRRWKRIRRMVISYEGPRDPEGGEKRRWIQAGFDTPEGRIALQKIRGKGHLVCTIEDPNSLERMTEIQEFPPQADKIRRAVQTHGLVLISLEPGPWTEGVEWTPQDFRPVARIYWDNT